jgi:L-threonylcarbamoyladenylate synthase
LRLCRFFEWQSVEGQVIKNLKDGCFTGETRVLRVVEQAEITAAAREAADLLRRGEVVAVPTETVYGLAGDALNADAAAKVFAAKERPAFDPLIVHVADASWIETLSEVTGAAEKLAHRLAETFWPGPLTMVLPAKDLVPDLVRSGLPTVALRCSAHPVMAAVVEELGRPLAAPSANRFGRISPVTTQDVIEELGGRIPLVLEGGACRHGLESTIVAVEDGRLTLLRPGPVTTEELEKFAPVQRAVRGGAVSAPGMLESHYAPRTPLRLWPEHAPLPDDAATSGVLVFGAVGPGFAAVEVLPSDPADAAPLFFAALRRLDSSGVARIYAREIPESGLGMAIMDRLRRAAHG